MRTRRLTSGLESSSLTESIDGRLGTILNVPINKQIYEIEKYMELRSLN